MKRYKIDNVLRWAFR